MARRTRYTEKALRSRRRRVVCGHFVTHATNLFCEDGCFVQTICNECRDIVDFRPMTVKERRDVVLKHMKIRVIK